MSGRSNRLFLSIYLHHSRKGQMVGGEKAGASDRTFERAARNPILNDQVAGKAGGSGELIVVDLYTAAIEQIIL